MALGHWIVADVTWAESDAAGENLLALHAMGCACRKANAFSLISDLGQAACDNMGLVVMSHLCPPQEWKHTLRHEGFAGLSAYMGLVFGAVQASCPAAMVVMLFRPSDAIANHVVACSPAKRVSTLRLAPLPFDFHAKACNHSGSNTVQIWQSGNHAACYTEGTSLNMNCMARSSQQLLLLDIIAVAHRDVSPIMFLGEWDAELASKCATHIMAQQSSISVRPHTGPLCAGSNFSLSETRAWYKDGEAWDYDQYFHFLLLKRPYDDKDSVALLAAIMWHRAGEKVWSRPSVLLDMLD
jgi:hypothetical protein